MKRFHYIDALRGYAILGVLVVHISQYVPGLPWPLSVLSVEGARGVQLFFVTSALTLSLTWHTRADGVMAFYIRRIFRIVPMFWLAIPLFVSLYGFAPRYWAPNGISWAHIVVTALFINGFHPDTISSVVPGGFTIAVEMTFYALFPLLVCTLRTWQITALALVASIVFAYALYPITVAVFHRLTPDVGYDLLNAFSYAWFPTQLPAFLTGILAFYFLREFSGVVPRLALRAILTMTMALFILLPLSIASTKILFVAYVLGFGLFAFCLGQGVGRLLVNWPIRFMGTISYSAYFWHFAALWLVDRLGLSPSAHDYAAPGWLQFAILFAGVVSATIIASSITFWLIEAPMINVGRQLAAAATPLRRRAAEV